MHYVYSNYKKQTQHINLKKQEKQWVIQDQVQQFLCLGVSTFDTLVQIHDLENNKQVFSGQLHDKASNSVQFDNTNENILFSAGTDGSLIQFDQRLQNKSLTLFKGPKPLLKVKQNSQDPNILAFIQHGSHIITLIDRRQPEKCIIKLDKHQGQVTSIDWHPNHPEYLLSTSVDEHCYIFDILKQKAILEYKAGDICQHCQWGSNDLSDWVSITWQNQVEILRTGL